jgi:hypothetical protein
MGGAYRPPAMVHNRDRIARLGLTAIKHIRPKNPRMTGRNPIGGSAIDSDGCRHPF